VKLLLTSSGITNDTLAHILEELAGKSFDDMKIVFIPTAALYDAGEKSWLINDMYRLIQRGAKVEIVDLAHLDKDELTERLKDSDVIFIGGGNPFYLSYWMEKSGMYDILSEILKSKVYAGISAGSMVMGLLHWYARQRRDRPGSYARYVKNLKISQIALMMQFLTRITSEPHYIKQG
jgi:dipeptidase E